MCVFFPRYSNTADFLIFLSERSSLFYFIIATLSLVSHIVSRHLFLISVAFSFVYFIFSSSFICMSLSISYKSCNRLPTSSYSGAVPLAASSLRSSFLNFCINKLYLLLQLRPVYISEKLAPNFFPFFPS